VTLTALNPFLEISAILGLATILSIVGQKLRQPLIIMFLATGILAGPACLGIVASHDQIALLANIGISLLLFIVGLKLDLNLIRTTGPVALATGVGQIVFTSAIGMVLALAIGMPWLHAVYVSVALTFSSTIIIVKLLSDKKEIDSLHGQIAVGFLIVQDIAAILALVLLTTFGATAIEDVSVLESSLLILAKGIGLLALVAVLMRFVLPGLLRRLAQSQELLVLFSIAWAVLMGAGSELLGFSKEVGAFLAGISLASTSYRDAIGARLVTLRDFLLLFFFIDLGARLDWSTVGSQVGPAVPVFRFCAHRQPYHRAGYHGIDGLPAPYRASGRPDRCPDFGIFPDRGRTRSRTWPYHRRDHGPDYTGGSADHIRLDLHDSLFRPPVPTACQSTKNFRTASSLPRSGFRFRPGGALC